MIKFATLGDNKLSGLTIGTLANCIHVMMYNYTGLDFNVICEGTCDLSNFSYDP